MCNGKQWRPHAPGLPTLSTARAASPAWTAHGFLNSPREYPVNCHLSRLQVFSYVATLLYVVHAVFSLIRWKSS